MFNCKQRICLSIRFTSLVFFIAIFSFILFSGLNSSAQTTIWIEDFTYSNGTIIGQGSPAITNWTADGVRDNQAGAGTRWVGIDVRTNQLQGRNTRNGNPDLNTWEIDNSNPIDIGGYVNVSVSIDVPQSNNNDNGDYIRFQYKIDSNNWENFETNGQINNDITTPGVKAEQANLTGNSLRIRIIMYNNNNNEYYYADNIVVTGTLITTPPTCTSPISPTNGEINFPVDGSLTWNTASGATGYKLYFGTDASATNIENGTDLGNVTSYTPSGDLDYLTDYYWKIVPYNGIGPATGCSIWSFTTGYCTAGSTTCDEYIDRVQIGSIDNNNTGCNNYGDFTSLSTDLTQGQTGVSISLTYSSNYTSDDIGIWIDWNQDGDFYDTDEQVVCQIGLTDLNIETFFFNVPSSAKLDSTLMRIRMKYSNSNCGIPCGNTTWGEVEDYTINVLSSCTVTPPIVATITQPDCITPTGSVVLNGLPATGAWELTQNPGGITTIQSGASTTISGLASGTYNFIASSIGTDIACPGSGTGLTAEYFNNMTLTGSAVLTRTDATVNYNWGNGNPGAPVNNDNFSVRWTGKILPCYSETYTFSTNSDDGIRLWVNGTQIIDNWTNHSQTINTGTIDLIAGQIYDIVLEFFENGGQAVAQLSWGSVSQSTQIIPQSNLYLNSDFTPNCVSLPSADVIINAIPTAPTAPTANNNTTIYNGAVQTASATAGSGETVQWFTSATGSFSTTAPSGTDVGTYTAWAEATNTSTGCVSATRTQVTLIINRKDLQVTATAPDISYGDAEPTVTVQYSGFEGTDNASVLNITGFTLGTNYTQGDPIGTYSTSIVIGTASDNNYTFDPLSSSNFLVGNNVLSVTAVNQTVSFGTHDGQITQNGTYTITGFLNGDNSSVISGLSSISFTSNYTETTNVGTSGITIIPDISGLSAANYTFTSISGNITIEKADQYISFSNFQFTVPLNSFDTVQVDVVSSSGLPVKITLHPESAAILDSVVGQDPSYFLTDIGETGFVTINATQAGNANYNAAIPESQTFDVTKSNQTISFPDIDDLSFYNGLTMDLQAVASSGLTIDYTVVSGPATVVGNTLSITGAGVVWIRASQIGDASYNVASDVTQSFTVAKGTQTISINVPSGTVDGTTQITASSTSGLPVTLTLGAGSDASSLTGTPGGSYTLSDIGSIGNGFINIVGNQAGDDNFFPATQVIQVIDLAKSNQTIAFTTVGNKIYGDPPITLSATATSGLAVLYTLVSGPASLSGNVLTITGVGTIIVETSQAGDASYNPAPTVTQQFEIVKATPSITLADIIKTYGDVAFTISPSSSSTGSYSFISGDDEVFTISGNTVTLTGAGITVLDITQEPTTNYNGTTLTVIFTVNKAASTISMTGATGYNYDGTRQGPETSFVIGSTGTVTYSYEGTGSTSYVSSILKPINAGTYAATAAVAEDNNYLGATSALHNFTIEKATAIINITPYSVDYDGVGHIAIGTAKGVSAEDLIGLDLSGTMHTNAVTYIDSCFFTDVTGNYTDDFRTINNVINQAVLSITASNQSKCFGETFTFNGTEFTSTGLIGIETIGTVTLTSTGDPSGAPAGTYTITPSTAIGGTYNPSNYLITYTDGEMVVNPPVTLTGATQNAAVCETSTATINLNGLLAGSTFNLDYSINNVDQSTITDLVAGVSGNSSFPTPELTAANNGQVLQITGITITSASLNCTKLFAQDVSLSVNPLPTLTSVLQTLSACNGSAATINLSGLVPSTTFTLSYTIDGGVTIVQSGLIADGSGNSSFTTLALTLANNNETLEIIKIEDETSGCIQNFTQNLILEVNPFSVGGTAAATDASVCENSSTIVVLTGYTGTIQWQQSDDGLTNWTNVTGGSGGTTETFTTPNLTEITYYKAEVTSGSCAVDISNVISVAVNPLPTLSTASLVNSVCEGSAATINLEGLVANSTVTINYSINNIIQTPITGLLADISGNSSFTTPVLNIDNDGETLQIKEILIESTGCVQRFIQDVIIEIDPNSVAGTATGNQTICSGNSPADITLTGETGTIQWQSSPDNSTWATITGATGTTLTSVQIGSPSASTYYRAEVTSGACASVFSSAIMVTVEATPISGSLSKIPNTVAVCDGDNVSATLTAGSGGNGSDELEASTNGGSNWYNYTSGTNISTAGLTEVQIRTRRMADYCTSSVHQTISWIVNPLTGITLTAYNTNACYSDGSAVLSYSALNGGANRYSIDYDDSDIVDINDAFLSGGSIILSFPEDSAPGSYNAVLMVSNITTGCVSENYNISIIINALPNTGAIIPD